MEGPTSSWGLRNRITLLTLQEHHDDDVNFLSFSFLNYPFSAPETTTHFKSHMDLTTTILSLSLCVHLLNRFLGLPLQLPYRPADGLLESSSWNSVACLSDSVLCTSTSVSWLHTKYRLLGQYALPQMSLIPFCAVFRMATSFRWIYLICIKLFNSVIKKKEFFSRNWLSR